MLDQLPLGKVHDVPELAAIGDDIHMAVAHLLVSSGCRIMGFR